MYVYYLTTALVTQSKDLHDARKDVNKVQLETDAFAQRVSRDQTGRRQTSAVQNLLSVP